MTVPLFRLNQLIAQKCTRYICIIITIMKHVFIYSVMFSFTLKIVYTLLLDNLKMMYYRSRPGRSFLKVRRIKVADAINRSLPHTMLLLEIQAFMQNF